MNYILYGALYPLIKKRLNKILKETLGEPDDFNIIKLDFDNSPVEEIVSEASLLPLGYEKKVVVVDNALFLKKDGEEKDRTAILELLKNSTDEISLIFIVRDEKIDEKGDIFNYVKDNGKIEFFVSIKKEEWPIYIRKYFKNKEVEIDTDAVNELALRVDGDLDRFINEADKLCLYKNKITISDVVLLVSKPLEDDAFQIANALFKGDNGLAISIYRDIKLLGYKFVDTLIPLLASQFRFYSEVFYLDSRGLEKEEIAKQLGVNEVRVKIALKNRRNVTRTQIAHALDDLYYLDYQTKSGQVDRSYGLELFLINFPN